MMHGPINISFTTKFCPEQLSTTTQALKNHMNTETHTCPRNIYAPVPANLNQTCVRLTKFNKNPQNITFHEIRLARSRVINDRHQKILMDMTLARTTDIDTTFRREHSKNWLDVGIRKVLRPVTSKQVFLGFPVLKSKC